jgi:hypothetical protein
VYNIWYYILQSNHESFYMRHPQGEKNVRLQIHSLGQCQGLQRFPHLNSSWDWRLVRKTVGISDLSICKLHIFPCGWFFLSLVDLIKHCSFTFLPSWDFGFMIALVDLVDCDSLKLFWCCPAISETTANMWCGTCTHTMPFSPGMTTRLMHGMCDACHQTTR